MNLASRALHNLRRHLPFMPPDTAAAIIADEVLSRIDGEGLRRQFAGSPRLKYLDVHRFIERDVRFCRLLGLDRSPPQRILDIGCGTGMFLYCARHFGHDGVGLDVEDEFYRLFSEQIGVNRQIEAVTPLAPLQVSGPFGLVTGLATVFDRVRTPHGVRTWNAAEWRYFLADVRRLLSPDGRLFLMLNKTGQETRPIDTLSTGWRRRRSFLLDHVALAKSIA